MNYLVDTHAFLWATSPYEELSKKAKSILLDAGYRKYISIITFWEISLKFSTGKLDLRGKQPEDLPAMAKELGFEIMNLDTEVTATFYKLPRLRNKDPFDRMLAWQAIKNDYVLLTKDKDFRGYEEFGLKTVW